VIRQGAKLAMPIRSDRGQSGTMVMRKAYGGAYIVMGSNTWRDSTGRAGARAL